MSRRVCSGAALPDSSSPSQPGTPRKFHAVPRHGSAEDALSRLADKRRKVLDLYYAGAIDAELLAQEEDRLTAEIQALREAQNRAGAEAARQAEVSQRFDQVLHALQELNLDEIWAEATAQERRVPVEELLDVVTIFPDHLEVAVKDALR